jgi:uncharacterized protein (DUF1501 family)
MGLGESRNLVSALALAIVLSSCAALSRKHSGDTPASAPPETKSSASSSAPQPDARTSPAVHAPTNSTPGDTPEMGSSNSAKVASSADAPVQRKVPPTPARNTAKGATSDARKAAPPPTAVKSTATDKPSAPALDLSSLEQRLKDTHAIGVFTKLSLKNQVDDLLAQFRAFHQGPTKTPPADLRHQYDLLMLKVLSLLQDSDPQLASAIASSREAIWGILVDPEKFAKI